MCAQVCVSSVCDMAQSSAAAWQPSSACQASGVATCCSLCWSGLSAFNTWSGSRRSHRTTTAAVVAQTTRQQLNRRRCCTAQHSAAFQSHAPGPHFGVALSTAQLPAESQPTSCLDQHVRQLSACTLPVVEVSDCPTGTLSCLADSLPFAPHRWASTSTMQTPMISGMQPRGSGCRRRQRACLRSPSGLPAVDAWGPPSTG